MVRILWSAESAHLVVADSVVSFTEPTITSTLQSHFDFDVITGPIGRVLRFSWPSVVKTWRSQWVRSSASELKVVTKLGSLCSMMRIHVGPAGYTLRSMGLMVVGVAAGLAVEAEGDDEGADHPEPQTPNRRARIWTVVSQFERPLVFGQTHQQNSSAPPKAG
jgi:hypothetical protein